MATRLFLLLLAVNTGWTCEDEYSSCRDRARAGECWGGGRNTSDLALEALVDCRASCREALRSLAVVPALVTELGGAGDLVTDRFGVTLQVCSLGRQVRRSVLKHRLVGERAGVWVPALTQEGFTVQDIPPRLFGMLQMQRSRGGWQEEPCHLDSAPFNCQVLVEDEEECRAEHSGLQQILPISDQLTSTMLAGLLPLAEAWAGGLPLTPSSVYGVRRYRRGSWLAGHLDQMATHVVSAILNIGQSGPGAPWPLHILDHSGRPHLVHLEQGQMLWYESARLLHGRPTPLEKDSYDNVFVHFKPKDRRWYGMEVMELQWEKDQVPKKRVKFVYDSEGGRKLSVERVKKKKMSSK